jgi:hypoxanthine phosphoribosyltransferase
MRIHDKDFEILISKEEIAAAIADMARTISRDYHGRPLTLVSVLNGAFLFTADLIRQLDLEVEVVFIRVKSYEGTGSSGKVRELIGLDEPLEGKHVLLLEDIVDSGYTINYLLDMLSDARPASLRVGTLLFKPDALKVPVKLSYEGIRIADRFVVGYGLDYDGAGRQFPDIYQLQE